MQIRSSLRFSSYVLTDCSYTHTGAHGYTGLTARRACEATLKNPAVLPSNPPQFQAGAKTGKKGQKKVGKKAEPQPLVTMMDESTGAYDKPVSIRQMLKQNKVDISWMDWLAWSPDACKEIKRLCTQVAKKRTPKAKSLVQDQSTMFNPATQPLQGQTLPPVFPTSRTMLYQKDTGKLQARWRGPFRIDGFSGSHGVSYKLRQFNGRKIKGIFHRNHLNPFTPRCGYLADVGPTFPPEQTIRAPRPRRKKKTGG